MMPRFKREFWKYFLQSNMTAKPCDSNYSWTPWYPQGLGEHVWNFPSICPAFLEKNGFKGFRVNPIWLPNHVTYDIKCGELFFPHGVMPVKFRLDLFSHFGEDFWRIYYFLFLIWLLKHDRWHNILFFCWPIYPEMTLKNLNTDWM